MKQKVLTNDEALAIAKDKMPTIISLAHQGAYAYCGDFGRSDLEYYVTSINYKTLNELKNYLHTIISEELYDKYFLKETEKNYIEKDNNLYCFHGGLDGLITYFTSEKTINNLDNLTYTISNKTNTSFDATLSFTYSSGIDDVYNKEMRYNASFINKEGKWIINNYKEEQ